MFVIKNITSGPLPIDQVVLTADEQLDVKELSPEMVAARDAGKLQVKSGDETFEERKADVEAIELSVH